MCTSVLHRNDSKELKNRFNFRELANVKELPGDLGDDILEDMDETSQDSVVSFILLFSSSMLRVCG